MEWLHLCDFHIGGSRGPQAEVLKTLLDKIDQLASRDSGAIDAIFLVGDIAYSGKASEYDKFTTDFLIPLRKLPQFKNATVFAVPGNHDVDCDHVLPISWEGIRKRNQGIFFSEDDDGKRVRSSRVKAFDAYWNFVQSNGIIGPNPNDQVSLLHINPNWPVDILLTNTAFFSDRSEESSKPITPVPLGSLRHHVKSGSVMKPIFILGHHCPTSYIADHEQQLKSFLFDKKAILLHGHEHNARATFNTDGTLRTIGFGASYVASLTDGVTFPYVNSFTHCKITSGQLILNSYSWQPHAGRWTDSTEMQFSECLSTEIAYPGHATVRLPLISNTPNKNFKQVITSLPRLSPKPLSLIPIEALGEGVWNKLLLLGENTSRIFRKDEATIRVLTEEVEKVTFSVDSNDRRDLVICIAGMNHVLSSKEIESFNTKLDTEDFASITVISLGKITDDAHQMCARLQSKKPIEVLVNKQLSALADRIISAEQTQALAQLDAAEHRVSILLTNTEIFLLVIQRTTNLTSFYIIDSNGRKLLASDPLVSVLRKGQPDLEILQYEGEDSIGPSDASTPFVSGTYLDSCYKEYNVIKYAALASVGIRFTDLPLEDLYVTASASEIQDANAGRLAAVVDDHLACYPVSDALRSHIQRQLLTAVQGDARQESSKAREFCQKFGAVLITGDPGSGKTCFIKNEILQYCKDGHRQIESEDQPFQSWYSSHLPIMVQLSELVAEKDLTEKGLLTIVARLLSRRGFHFPSEEIERFSKNGRIAWFFDGLDEVVSVEKRALVVQCVNDLTMSSLPLGNRIVVTSRPAAVHVVNLLPSLHKLEIQGLTDAEISILAARILRLKLAESQEGLKVVDQGSLNEDNNLLIAQLIKDCKTNPGVARLAQNPLLLTLLIMIYANSGALSAKRHLIYEQAIQTLASVRGREAGHTPISAQDLRERLGAVALSVYKKESGLLPSRVEVLEVMKSAMRRQRGEDVTLQEADSFIQKVAESTGLIAIENRHGESSDLDIITFMHHSFLEYFAAIGLSRNLDKFDFAILVSQPRWREILTLLSGIIGENEDIAPILARILESGKKEEDIDSKLLVFAIDCALECEVPSDATQRLLAKAIKESILTGPAKGDPWVQSEIGQRLSQLLIVCGGGEFDKVLGGLIESTDPNVTSAAIRILAFAYSKGYESAALTSKFVDACDRNDEPILKAICFAVGKSEQLRPQAALSIIHKCLTKSQPCRRAAFEAISAVPSLAGGHWSEIINGIEDNSLRTSRSASLAAIHAGLNGDLITLNGTKREILLRALNRMSGLESEDMQFSLKQDTIERLLSSLELTDRVIAIQLLPKVDAGERYAYQKLFSVLRSDSSDHKEAAAALTALKMSNPVKALFNLGDLRTVAERLSAPHADIRVASMRLLGSFGGDIDAIEAILGRNMRDMSVEEYSACVQSLSNSKILMDRVKSILFEELDYYLNENRAMSEDNLKRFGNLLDALGRLGKPGPSSLVEKVKELVTDFRVNPKLKKRAMLCYPAIVLPSERAVDSITAWFLKPPIGLDSELVQLPSILAKQCRQSVDFVIACIDSLTKLRSVLYEFHKRLSLKEITEDTEFSITELRSGIDEISQIIVTFSEFIETGIVQTEMPLYEV